MRVAAPVAAGRRLLFCWELGDHHGHVSPYLGLLETLRDRGWSVSLALSNTAPGGRACRDAGFRLFQAPVCRQSFSGIPEVPFSYAELLLGFGFAHADTLAGLVAAWRGLCSLVEPDLMITSNAPSAMLAARAEGVPAVRIGMGFDCPPSGDRTPLTRPWEPGIDERLEKSEALCRSTINEVLRLNGAQPVSRVTEVLCDCETLLCTYPELDYFAPRPGPYIGLLSERTDVRAAEGEPVDLLAYVRLEHPHTERLFAAIRSLGLRAIVYCPDISNAGMTHWSGEGLRFSDKPLDLDAWLPKSRVVASYAGHGMTARALLAGRPLLLLPTHLEQQSNASKVAALGAALVAGPAERNPKLERMLRNLLDDPRYTDAARQFSARHAGPAAAAGLEEAVAACERAAGFPTAMPALQ